MKTAAELRALAASLCACQQIGCRACNQRRRLMAEADLLEGKPVMCTMFHGDLKVPAIGRLDPNGSPVCADCSSYWANEHGEPTVSL